jgi:predicted RNA binding protein YcfA (HicA-like mRNA interferase family)
LTRLHPVRAREVIRFLESLGFVQVRQKGSHKFFRHPDGRTATVPDHRGEDLGRGILAKILRDAESSAQEFLDWHAR